MSAWERVVAEMEKHPTDKCKIVAYPYMKRKSIIHGVTVESDTRGHFEITMWVHGNSINAMLRRGVIVRDGGYYRLTKKENIMNTDQFDTENADAKLRLLHRRGIFVPVTPDAIVELFSAASRDGDSVSLPIFPELPDGYIVVDAHYEPVADRFLIKIAHPSFDAVPEGEFYPVITSPIAQEIRTINLDKKVSSSQ